MEWNWKAGGSGISVGNSELRLQERPEFDCKSAEIFWRVGKAACPTREETRRGGRGGSRCSVQKVRTNSAVLEAKSGANASPENSGCGVANNRLVRTCETSK